MTIHQIMAECDCRHDACALRGYCMADRIRELEAAREADESLYQDLLRENERLKAGQSVKVEPLDMSILLRHAFISGRRSATGSPSHEMEAWAEYEPPQCAAYRRILSAIETAPATPAEAARVILAEWQEGEGPLGDLACYSVDEDGVMQPDIDGRWVEFSKLEAVLRALAEGEG